MQKQAHRCASHFRNCMPRCAVASWLSPWSYAPSALCAPRSSGHSTSSSVATPEKSMPGNASFVSDSGRRMSQIHWPACKHCTASVPSKNVAARMRREGQM